MHVILLTGPLGVGKSSAIEGLSRKFCRVKNAQLDADCVAMTRPGGANVSRLDLVEDNLADCAKNFGKWGAKYLFMCWLFEDSTRLSRFRTRLARLGFKTLTYGLVAKPEILHERIGQRDRPFIFSDDNVRWLASLNKATKDLRDTMIVDTTELSPRQVIDWIADDIELRTKRRSSSARRSPSAAPTPRPVV